jgi:RNA polymerase sigma-70 factor (ECF subfamily)
MQITAEFLPVMTYNFVMAHRTNDEWLFALQAAGELQTQALEDLRILILRGLPYALAGKLSSDSPEFEALAEETAQETLMRVLDYLHTFEGRSQFTTWVHKIAVREALSQLRRHRWRDVPLPEMRDEESDGISRDMPDPQPAPDVLAERSDLLERVNRIIAQELTEKQRRAVDALAIQGLSIETAAWQLNMNPNALYKLLHDARIRLKHRLEAEGLTPHEVLAIFEFGGVREISQISSKLQRSK